MFFGSYLCECTKMALIFYALCSFCALIFIGAGVIITPTFFNIEYPRYRMNNYSLKQNRCFTASACEAGFFCACASDMKLMGIAAAMSVLLIIGVISVLRAVRVSIVLIIAAIIILVIIRSIVHVPIRTFQS